MEDTDKKPERISRGRDLDAVPPNAKKAHGRKVEPAEFQTPVTRGHQKGRSQEVCSQFRGPEDGVELSAKGMEAYQGLLDSVDLDPQWLDQIVEKKVGDKDKIVRFLQDLALGARHRDALQQLGWTWSHLSGYRQRSPGLQRIYNECKRIGEEFRGIQRDDEAHRRATDGYEEPIYSAKGDFCGNRIRYSDTLLAMFLKADNPDKFMERSEVKSTGVVLNVSMGLRDNVSSESMKPVMEAESE